MKELALDCTV